MPENPSLEHDSSRDPLKTELSQETHVHARTPVPHHLISSQVGRPLWDYRSDTELLQGFLDALNAHELLWKQQITLDDINSESILLAEDPDALGAIGFLSDIEAANMPPDTALLKPGQISSATKYEDNLRPVSITEVTTGRRMALSRQGCTAITGNLQFMAVKLLRAAIGKRSVQRTAEHDVESFTWVLGYCVLRKLYNKAYTIQKDGAECKSMKESFATAFGKLSIRDILASRELPEPFRWCDDPTLESMEPFFQKHISRPLRELLRDLESHAMSMQRQPPRVHHVGFSMAAPAKPLTHYALQQRIQYAINELRIDPSCNRNH